MGGGGQGGSNEGGGMGSGRVGLQRVVRPVRGGTLWATAGGGTENKGGSSDPPRAPAAHKCPEMLTVPTGPPAGLHQRPPVRRVAVSA